MPATGRPAAALPRSPSFVRPRLGRLLAAAAATAALLGSCREVGESDIDILAPRERSVSFSAEVQPILTEKCAFSGCHAPPEAIPGANWEEGRAYANLVNVPSVESAAINADAPELVLSRVEPFDPSRSYLFLKITGCDPATGCVGDPMPLGRSPLTAADLATIQQWIEQGAPNN